MQIRSTIPSGYNKFYMMKSSGGENGAVRGYPTVQDADVLANCVGYANGRFNEIIGSFNYQFVNDPKYFITEAQSKHLQVTNTPSVGGIMVWTGNSGSNHVAVVEHIVNDNEIYTSESNYNGKPFCFVHRINTNGNWGDARTYQGCIKNPSNPENTSLSEEDKTHSISYNSGSYNPSPDSQELITFTNSIMAFNNAVPSLRNAKGLRIPIGNPIAICKQCVMDIINVYDDKDFEPQLVSKEFIELEILDFYNHHYNYDPKYFESTTSYLNIKGVVGDYNSTYTCLTGYRVINDGSIKGVQNLEADKDSYYNKFKYGFFDTTNRNLSIIQSRLNEYFQNNSNSLEAYKARLLTTKNISEQELELNKEKRTMQHNQTQTSNGIQLAGNVVNAAWNMLSGNFMSSIANLSYAGNSATDMIFENQSFNKIYPKEVALNAYRINSNYHNALRAQNASIKDIDNKADIISNQGNDIALNIGNDLDGVLLEVKTGETIYLKNAYNYFRYYGVIHNQFFAKFSDLFKQRQNWNFIQVTDINFREQNVNEDVINALTEQFKAGVRVWNTKENFRNYTIQNRDL